jgi:integrase
MAGAGGAVSHGRLGMRPSIKMLREPAAKDGFFEAHQYFSVVAHLPAALRPVIATAYITGWRVADEILPLEWRQIDFGAGEIRLYTSKNLKGRVFPFTTELRKVLETQRAECDQLKTSGVIVPWVFWRMIA